MVDHISTRSNSLTSPDQKITDNDHTVQKSAHSTVTCMYQAYIAGYMRNVTVLWNRNLMSDSLSISIDSIESDRRYTCKIDLKLWHFWARKGCKTFEVDGSQIDAYWDFRSAKFSTSSEPCSDFYVALTYDDEVVLLLGDLKKKAYKKTRSRPALVDAVLLYKKEDVFGKKSFSTRARFDQRKREHDVIVENSLSGPGDPEMWISIDGNVLVHVQNLQWKFRGNQTVQVDNHEVQVFWDVHGWLFCEPGSGHGLFIFKTGSVETEDDQSSDCSGNTGYYSTMSSRDSQLCLFLYAWRIH